MNSSQSLLIFPHMPKTGGDTFNRILVRYYRGWRDMQFGDSRAAIARLRDMTVEEENFIDCIRGHGVFFGLHHYFHRPASYVAFVRDPVDRVISQYYFYKHNPNTYLYREIHENGFTLDQFAGVKPNVQLRFCLGYDHLAGKPVEANDFRDAIEIVESNFAFLGVLDNYIESQYLVQKALKWNRLMYFRRTNTGEHRPSVHDVPQASRDVIAKANSFDAKLHQYALGKVREKIEQLSSGERAELETYKERNKIFQTACDRFDETISIEVIQTLLEIGLDSITIYYDPGALPPALSEVIEYLGSVGIAAKLKLLERTGKVSNVFPSSIGNEKILAFPTKGRDAFMRGELMEMAINPDRVVFGTVPEVVS
ncbi:MAG: sulfotransferase family 2 domain-containing protein [Bdellovibrionales bacterium]|nr:sulfotransferase family 2 domain-containing protein [Bdellovibrionales bacterium]